MHIQLIIHGTVSLYCSWQFCLRLSSSSTGVFFFFFWQSRVSKAEASRRTVHFEGLEGGPKSPSLRSCWRLINIMTETWNINSLAPHLITAHTIAHPLHIIIGRILLCSNDTYKKKREQNDGQNPLFFYFHSGALLNGIIIVHLKSKRGPQLEGILESLDISIFRKWLRLQHPTG